MSVFDAALDTLFGDPSLAIDVTYTPASGRSFVVRAIRQRPDIQSELGGGPKLQQQATIFDVRVSQIASVTKGDTLQDDVAAYRVMSGQIKDARRGILTIEAALV
jgi:hypothetical protein